MEEIERRVIHETLRHTRGDNASGLIYAATLGDAMAIDAERIEQAVQAAADAVRPIDDIRGTAAHRRAIVAPLVRRALRVATDMAQGTDFSFETQRGLAVEVIF